MTACSKMPKTQASYQQTKTKQLNKNVILILQTFEIIVLCQDENIFLLLYRKTKYVKKKVSMKNKNMAFNLVYKRYFLD